MLLRRWAVLMLWGLLGRFLDGSRSGYCVCRSTGLRPDGLRLYLPPGCSGIVMELICCGDVVIIFSLLGVGLSAVMLADPSATKSLLFRGAAGG
ncbi:hypothetical protein Nepgr_017994 [Nepenthes gracilis]|uniref:Secreted protein n=1 Tax=Nepenthes gracilis TaxID=150966 RepID=A0AAD3XT21_NEPGR|nr:hypothetical protein Nepgr_017994 [Nepenthes gracilis]